MLSFTRVLVLASLACAAISACGGTVSGIDGDAGTQVCVPAERSACVGPAGCSGFSFCNADGTSVGACICDHRDASVLPDASGLDGSASHDGSTFDAFQPDAFQPDAFTFDAGRFDSSISHCAPADVTSFVPPPYHPVARQVGACTPTQISGFYTACFTGQNMAACNSFKMAAPTCAGCLETPSTAAAWGATVTQRGIISINVAGCMEVLGGANGLACAKATESEQACVAAACDANCPVTDDASFQLYLACTQQVAANGCASYAQASQACTLAQADAGAASCTSGQDFQGFYDNIAPVVCGP